MPDLKIKTNDGVVIARVVIQKAHVGVTSIDLWELSHGSGRPDAYLRRIKPPNEKENQFVVIGTPETVANKVVQWSWMPSRPPTGTEGWEVSIDVQQDGGSVKGMPVTLAGDYPDGRGYGLYESWFRLVAV